MSTVIGIDVGGSTTKIVGFNADRSLIAPMFVKAADPVTSIYGAFGKFTVENNLKLEDIRRVMVTGVGSSYIAQPIYNLECTTCAEFDSLGLGGLYLSGLDKAIIVSVGTGTAIVYAEKGKESKYLGGTGLGGGTVVGLSKKMLDMDNISHIVRIAEGGDLSKVDLRITDISKKDILLPKDMTASNFGKMSDLSDRSDLALGIINMVFETVGMLAIFAARSFNINDIVLTGNLTTIPQAKPLFDSLSQMFGVNFIIPENSQFGTVIGAALHAFK